MNKKRIYLIFPVFFILILLVSCAKEQLDEESILGNWEAIKGDYEELSFTKEGDDRLFYSYLNQQPFSDGKWSIKGNSIYIDLSSGEKEIFKNVIVKEDGTLSIDDDKQLYQRIKSKAGELEQIINKILAINNFKFSDQIDAEFKWFLNEGDEILILSTDDYTDLSNSIKIISNFFKENGFSAAENNITENTEAYENDNIKVLIKSDAPINYNPETDESISIKGEKAIIEIYIGFIES